MQCHLTFGPHTYTLTCYYSMGLKNKLLVVFVPCIFSLWAQLAASIPLVRDLLIPPPGGRHWEHRWAVNTVYVDINKVKKVLTTEEKQLILATDSKNGERPLLEMQVKPKVV